jgi:hypothetical protein
MDEQQQHERLARIETHMEHMIARLDDVVSRAEFLPVKLVTYGLSGGILTAFLTALIIKVVGGQ